VAGLLPEFLAEKGLDGRESKAPARTEEGAVRGLCQNEAGPDGGWM